MDNKKKSRVNYTREEREWLLEFISKYLLLCQSHRHHSLHLLHLAVQTNLNVVFELQKFGVLVADWTHNKMNIHPESGADTGRKELGGTMHTDQRNLGMDSIMEQSSLGKTVDALIFSTAPVCREEEVSEYEQNVTNQILDPEQPLDPIDGQVVEQAETIHPDPRITDDRNTVCKIYIDNEEFICHLTLLQRFSEVFNKVSVLDKAELSSDEVSTDAFAFIYKWMISKDPIYMNVSLELFVEIFKASVFLEVQELINQYMAFFDNTEAFSEKKAYQLYKVAKQKDVKGIREIMLPRIQKFFLKLVGSRDWLNIDKDDVVTILRSDDICVNCEIEVFLSAIRWLKCRWQERQKYLIDMMNCVRFENIEQWQLMKLKHSIQRPKYVNLTGMRALRRMIDNGLQYVILKNIQHENSSLCLQELRPRNWSGIYKRYFTYREFVFYLRTLR